MIKEIAATQAVALDDWARQWSGDATEGASEISFLMQRTARKIRAIIGETTDADAQQVAGPGTEPLVGTTHRDPAEHRTELRD